MRRSITPVAMATAFIALMGVSQAVKAIEVGEPMVVGAVCESRRVVEEHLALIEAAPDYSLVRERFQEDVAAGRCVQMPPMPLVVEEKGREVKLVDGDGDLMEITVVRIGSVWTLSGRIIGKNGG